ncbi:platelet endothelial aggregation receptor 1-like [Mya arenaria]|uniref:platelet endothelial aggregation receptor 1-like n=1 Tax=Mya arenaria TaxID=6604 RepID=UPI0022E7BD7D|nr:platelet endothelial aggregation receptor 1-like [Mya arenaria]
MMGCIDGYSGYNCTDSCNSNCTTCQQYDKSYCTSCYNEYIGSSCRCPPNCACDEVSDQCTSCENMYSNPGYKCQCHTKFCIMNDCKVCINRTYYVHEGLNSCCPCPTACKDAICSSQYQCLNGCVDGLHVNDCSKKCADINIMCLSCSQDTGSCTRCDEWFYPDSNGNCVACSATCTDSKCEGGSGRCIAGCIDGYGGNQCEDRCDILCRTCDRMTGECNGCIHPSLYGPYCNLSCSSTCINSECDMIGECAIGCTEGYTGLTCTQQVTTAPSVVTVGLTAGVGVIGLAVGGLVAASLTVYILKRRRRGKKPKVAELGGQRPLETGNSSIDSHNLYDQLNKKQICTPQDRQQYEMIQSSTVDNKQNGEEERDYEFAGDNEYYNEC